MEERRQIVRGLIAAHLLAFLVSAVIGYTTNLVTGIIFFAVTLPPAAYLSPKILEKLPL